MKLIPALTGQPPPNDELRHLLALPARLGGIALTNPTSHADVEFSASTKISDPAILQQSLEYSGDVGHDQVEAKGKVCKMKRELYKQAADSLKQSFRLTSLTTHKLRFPGWNTKREARLPYGYKGLSHLSIQKLLCTLITFFY